MAADRSKRLVRQLGLAGVAMEIIYLYRPFLKNCADDLLSFFTQEDISTMEVRFGQLKPPIFKFPLESVWLSLFALAIALSLVVIWVAAWKNLARSEDDE